jgi:hypothetical protein
MWYKTARIFAVLLSFFAVIFVWSIATFSLGETPKANYPIIPDEIIAIVSLVGMIVTMVGTASTILIGWRAEHRQAEEFKLRIKQLELQLGAAKEAQRKPDPLPPENCR